MANNDSGSYKSVHGASKLSLLIAFGAGAVVAWFMLWVNAQGMDDPAIQQYVANPIIFRQKARAKMQEKPVVGTAHIANAASPVAP